MVRVAYHAQMEQPTTIKRPPPRLRTYSVGEDVALELLSGRSVAGNIDVPEGARVRSVHNDYQRMSFVLVVEHESFDEVTQGMVIPYADTLAMMLQTVDSLKREAVRDFLRGFVIGIQNQDAPEEAKAELTTLVSALPGEDSVMDTAIALGADQRGKPDLPPPWHWVGKQATKATTGYRFSDLTGTLPSMVEQAEHLWKSVKKDGAS